MLSNKQKKIQYIGSSLTIALMLVSGVAAAESNPSSLKLAQATAIEKQDGQYWIKKGHELRDAGKHEEAIQAYRKAESLGAGSDDLTFGIAYTYGLMGRKREAYWEYSKVANSENPKNRIIACEEMQTYKHDRNRYLSDPYFADLYTHGGWQTLGDAAFIEMKARYGFYGEGNLAPEYYVYAAVERDNRSGIVGGFPEEIVDNAARFGVGYTKPLTDDYSLYFIAEAGVARDLIDKNRDRNNDDFRAGLQYFNSWNTEYDCRSTDTTPNRFILSVSSELIYYSRYDDAVIFNLDVRPGIRLIETRQTDVDAFLLLNYNANLENSNNNVTEVGVGVSWVPDRDNNFKITARTGKIYYDDGDSDTNSVIEFQHYISW